MPGASRAIKRRRNGVAPGLYSPPVHIVLSHPTRLPVVGYGGIERVVVALARGLVELGHRVTLISSPGSQVPEVTVVPVAPKILGAPGFSYAPYFPAGADILHTHFQPQAIQTVPHVWTLHGNTRPGVVPPPNTIFVSRNHATRAGRETFVHNGLDPAEFEFRREKDNYDLYLGRLHSVKGYQWAIEGTRRLGRRLVIAGGWRPSLSRNLKYLGSVDGTQKRELLAGARLLWMPALWEEPFGLTLIEALFSGTPVLGTHRGALPEIVTPDVGELGDTLDELVELAPRAERKDPDACRARAVAQFTHVVMAEEYVRCYRSFLDTGHLPPGRPGPAA
jgi:glycosyltransferase involved in cell wall biosynthesis